jgi:hypothetical protein
MIYLLDRKRLLYKRLNFKKYAAAGFLTISTLSTGSYFFGKYKAQIHNTMEIIKYESVLLTKRHNEFSEDKLIDKLNSYNLKFPHIALAQAKLESGNFKSRIFKENHNLFGMKEAKLRPTTALGTQYDHAYYSSWEKSIEDYVLWFASYGRKCRTEDDFFSILAVQYAEDSNYVVALKKIIEKPKR